ncbi:MAG: YkgJ family cysteine cluster protein [Aestuariivirga sp.]
MTTDRDSDWIMQGECNQCGDCCRQATNLITIGVTIADEAYGRVRFGEPIGQVNGLGGVRVFQIRGPLLQTCPQLDGDRCAIHDTKPDHCKTKPSLPEDIEGLPRCSYYFVHRETGDVRGVRPQG